MGPLRGGLAKRSVQAVRWKEQAENQADLRGAPFGEHVRGPSPVAFCGQLMLCAVPRIIAPRVGVSVCVKVCVVCLSFG